jgi:hypothetical protein
MIVGSFCGDGDCTLNWGECLDSTMVSSSTSILVGCAVDVASPATSTEGDRLEGFNGLETGADFVEPRVSQGSGVDDIGVAFVGLCWKIPLTFFQNRFRPFLSSFSGGSADSIGSGRWRV